MYVAADGYSPVKLCLLFISRCPFPAYDLKPKSPPTPQGLGSQSELWRTPWTPSKFHNTVIAHSLMCTQAASAHTPAVASTKAPNERLVTAEMQQNTHRTMAQTQKGGSPHTGSSEQQGAEREPSDCRDGGHGGHHDNAQGAVGHIEVHDAHMHVVVLREPEAPGLRRKREGGVRVGNVVLSAQPARWCASMSRPNCAEAPISRRKKVSAYACMSCPNCAEGPFVLRNGAHLRMGVVVCCSELCPELRAAVQRRKSHVTHTRGRGSS